MDKLSFLPPSPRPSSPRQKISYKTCEGAGKKGGLAPRAPKKGLRKAGDDGRGEGPGKQDLLPGADWGARMASQRGQRCNSVAVGPW